VTADAVAYIDQLEHRVAVLEESNRVLRLEVESVAIRQPDSPMASAAFTTITLIVTIPIAL
jgi:hypothetical protein